MKCPGRFKTSRTRVVKRPPGEPPNVPSRNAPCAARAHPSRRGDSLSARGMKMLQDGIDQTEIAVGSVQCKPVIGESRARGWIQRFKVL